MPANIKFSSFYHSLCKLLGRTRCFGLLRTASLAILVGVITTAFAQAPPANAVECAKESERCNFTGSSDVSYGAGTKWVTKTATDGISCDVASFGVDPAPNVLKTCRIVVETTKCADEGAPCVFNGTRTVRFGANGVWAEKKATAAILCGVAAFGRDPVPNVRKQCFLAPPVLEKKLSTFGLILASDTQYPYCESKICKEGPKDSKTANQWHSQAIGALSSTENIYQGVVINGDLTNTMDQYQIDVFENLYGSKFVLYPGLGNHDYQNYTAFNDGKPYSDSVGTYDGNAASRYGGQLNLMQYFTKLVRSNRRIQGFDWNDSGYWNIYGSLAYYWDIGDYRFVQLNNFPPFSYKFSNFASKKGGNENFEIRSSLPWLTSLLNRSRDKKVVLNMHSINSNDGFGVFDVSPVTDKDGNYHAQAGAYSQLIWLPGALEFSRLLGEHPNVVAIFAGHLHGRVGNLDVFRDGLTNQLTQKQTSFDRRDSRNVVIAGKEVPVLYCGSAEYNALLGVKFEASRITAQAYSTKNGTPTPLGAPVVLDIK